MQSLNIKLFYEALHHAKEILNDVTAPGCPVH